MVKSSGLIRACGLVLLISSPVSLENLVWIQSYGGQRRWRGAVIEFRREGPKKQARHGKGTISPSSLRASKLRQC